MQRLDQAAILTAFLAVALCVPTGACTGSSGEKAVLDKYFQASRLRDNLTLGNIATVSFDARREGVVQAFTITSVSPERRQTLRTRELAKAHEEARAADAEFTKRKKAYQDGNLDAIDRVLRAERQRAKIRGKDAEVQKAWTKWREETAQHSKRLSEARAKLAAERGVAELSVSGPESTVDATQFAGELVSRDVTIAAQVRTPGGETVDKTLVVTLERGMLRRENARDRTGRWIVTQIKEAAK